MHASLFTFLPKSIQSRAGQNRKQSERQGKIANSIPHRARQLEIICYTTKNVHFTTTITNFQFFLNQDPTSIYPTLNRFLLLSVNLNYIDKKSLSININY